MRKNRFLIGVVFMVLAAMAFAQNALRPLSAEEASLTATEDDFDIEQLANGTLRITGYSGAAKNVVIPATISGVRVTSIGSSAFTKKGLRSVVIPDGITEIIGGEYFHEGGTFSDNNLTSVSIGKGLKIIPSYAFTGNNHLTTLSIPDGITEIDDYAFHGCALSDITWGKGLVKIGVEAFRNNNFTELTIPNGVTYIARVAFLGNPLTVIVLPASLAQYSIYYSNNPRGFADTFYSDDYGGSSAVANVTRVTVPANMAEENLEDFPTSFVNYWKSQNKAAGTYMLNGRLWKLVTPQELQRILAEEEVTRLKTRGKVYYDRGEYDLAIAEYTAALKINPNDADILNRRGAAYEDKDDYDPAIADYTQAIRIDPNYTLAKKYREIARGKKFGIDENIITQEKAVIYSDGASENEHVIAIIDTTDGKYAAYYEINSLSENVVGVSCYGWSKFEGQFLTFVGGFGVNVTVSDVDEGTITIRYENRISRKSVGELSTFKRTTKFTGSDFTAVIMS
jgi:tetratricopeptide (TPR) repeat protein